MTRSAQPNGPFSTPSRRAFLQGAGGLALGGLLAACGSNTGGGGDALQVWYHQYGEDGTKDAVFRYAEAYKKTEVKVSWKLGDYTNTVLPTGLQGSNAPDVFESSLDVEMVKAKQVVALDDILADAKSDYLPAGLQSQTLDGKVYGIPMVIDFGVLYYRKSLLEQAGIAPPETLDDLVAAAKELTTGDTKGLFLGNDNGVTALTGPLTWSTGLSWLTDDRKIGFNDPRLATALTKTRQLVDDKSLLSGSAVDWWEPANFINGTVAMQWGGFWAFPAIQKELKDDFGVVAWPASDAQGKPSTFQGGWSAFVSAKSDKIDDAKAFVKWLWGGPEGVPGDWCLNYGFHLPARKSLADSAAKLQEGTAAEAAKIAQEVAVPSNPYWTPSMRTAYEDAFTRVLQEGSDPGAAIQAAVEKIQSELDKQS